MGPFDDLMVKPNFSRTNSAGSHVKPGSQSQEYLTGGPAEQQQHLLPRHLQGEHPKGSNPNPPTQDAPGVMPQGTSSGVLDFCTLRRGPNGSTGSQRRAVQFADQQQVRAIST